MKALSVKQPWANRIASGEKTIETRVWQTDHRGQLLIVSSKVPAIAPAGCAVAVAEVVDCRPMVTADEPAAGCECYGGAYAWVLANVRAIKPFPVRGFQRLYEVDLAPGQIEYITPPQPKGFDVSKKKPGKDAKPEAKKEAEPVAGSLPGEMLERIRSAEAVVAEREKVVADLKDTLKNAKGDYEEAVRHLRQIIRDSSLPLLDRKPDAVDAGEDRRHVSLN